MEDHCIPLSLAYFYQDEGIEELRHCFMYISELETAVLSVKEELTRREFEIFNLKNILNKTMKERNEAQEESEKLVVEKLVLQQQLNQHQPPPPPISGTCSTSEESEFSDRNMISVSEFNDPIPCQNQPLQSHLPEEVIVKLAADRELPEKGKLLQAVKEAGPLLQTLLLAGPLPQWQHPPPRFEIPPVTVSSSPAANRLTHQHSFNSFSACLCRKRGLELCETSPDSSSSPPPFSKHKKLALL